MKYNCSGSSNKYSLVNIRTGIAFKKIFKLVKICILILLPNLSFASTSFKQHCTAINIELQQRNAPNKLINFNSDKPISTSINNFNPVKQYSYKIVSKLVHDTKSFTQGLVVYKNYIFESVGLLGKSKIQKLDINTGEVTHHNKLKNYLFAEGLSVLNDNLVQLTWKTERILSYSADNLEKISEDKINGEGWGVTSVNNHLIVSDGSAMLQVLDKDKIEIKRLLVSSNGKPIRGLNELEYANGYIYSNVWPTDCIAKINPESGDVVAWINLEGLFPKSKRPHWTAILNGIAYQKENKSFFVTGKYWPYIYELKFNDLIGYSQYLNLSKAIINGHTE